MVHDRPIISLRHSGPRYCVRWSRTEADGVHQQRHISAQRDLRSTTPTCSVCTEVNAARARTASAQGLFIVSYFLHCLDSVQNLLKGALASAPDSRLNLKFENFMQIEWREEKLLKDIVGDKMRLRF